MARRDKECSDAEWHSDKKHHKHREFGRTPGQGERPTSKELLRDCGDPCCELYGDQRRRHRQAKSERGYELDRVPAEYSLRRHGRPEFNDALSFCGAKEFIR